MGKGKVEASTGAQRFQEVYRQEHDDEQEMNSTLQKVYRLFLSAQVKDPQTNSQIGSRSGSVSSAGKLLGVHNSQGSLHRQDF